MRFTDNYRRRVITEVRDRGRLIWNPAEPHFSESGARSYAFIEIAGRLGGGADALDVRRMWRKIAISYYKFKARRTTRRPKFYNEMGFLASIPADMLHYVSHMF